MFDAAQSIKLIDSYHKQM